MKVYIAAGHQGKGTGAHSQLVKNGNIMTFDEAKMAEELVIELKEKLKNCNHIIYEDFGVLLTNKIRRINSLKDVGVAMELHFNTCGKNGVECFVADNASSASIEYAEDFCDLISKALEIKNGGVRFERQSARKRLGFVHDTKCPAVIIEVCYIDNLKDVKAYEDENKHKKLLSALQGYIEYTLGLL